MPLGRPIPPLTLDEEERASLDQLTRRQKAAQALALRARIVLACASGKTNTAVAEELRVSKPTVGSGAAGSWNSVWMDCWTNRVLAPRARSPMRMWRELSPSHWRPHPVMLPIGAHDRWPSEVDSAG